MPVVKHFGIIVKYTISKHFSCALSKAVGAICIPEKWQALISAEAVETPWKHFYLPTGEHVMRLLASYPPLKGSGDLVGLRFLDIGCTPAIDVLLACLGAHVTMVDHSADELHKGMRLGEQLEVSQFLHPVLADAFRLPLQPETYDVVWNSRARVR